MDNFVRCHINPHYRHPPRRCGEQVLIGPVTMPAIVRERIALDPSAASKSAVVVAAYAPMIEISAGQKRSIAGPGQ